MALGSFVHKTHHGIQFIAFVGRDKSSDGFIPVDREDIACDFPNKEEAGKAVQTVQRRLAELRQ